MNFLIFYLLKMRTSVTQLFRSKRFKINPAIIVTTIEHPNRQKGKFV